eukprot:351855-Chlamydomonas_euryale.AAC.4
MKEPHYFDRTTLGPISSYLEGMNLNQGSRAIHCTAICSAPFANSCLGDGQGCGPGIVWVQLFVQPCYILSGLIGLTFLLQHACDNYQREGIARALTHKEPSPKLDMQGFVPLQAMWPDLYKQASMVSPYNSKCACEAVRGEGVRVGKVRVAER